MSLALGWGIFGVGFWWGGWGYRVKYSPLTCPCAKAWPLRALGRRATGAKRVRGLLGRQAELGGKFGQNGEARRENEGQSQRGGMEEKVKQEEAHRERRIGVDSH